MSGNPYKIDSISACGPAYCGILIRRQHGTYSHRYVLLLEDLPGYEKRISINDDIEPGSKKRTNGKAQDPIPKCIIKGTHFE